MTFDFFFADMCRLHDKYPTNCFPQHHFNSLFRHWLDCFVYFGNSLHFSDTMIIGYVSLKRSYDVFLSNDVLVKFCQFAIDSCCIIQDRLNVERKPGCIQELLSALEQTLLAIKGVILHLIKRNDYASGHEQDGPKNQKVKVKSIHRIASILIEELLHRCPLVVAPYYEYSTPLLNILFKADYKPRLFYDLTRPCISHTYQFVKIVSELDYDLNATDYHGNTLLHILLSDAILEVDYLKRRHYIQNYLIKQVTDKTIGIVELLLDNGAYPHAKNKQRKSPVDALWNMYTNIQRFYLETLVKQLADLLGQYDSSMSLKYMAATKIITSKIPYKDKLPIDVVKFVNLH